MAATRARHSSTGDGPLGASLAAFLAGPASIAVATRDADLHPDVAQGIGCRVTADGRVRVLVSRVQAPGAVACVEAGAPLAVTFSMPSTSRTVQLKAPRGRVGPAQRADLEAVRRYREVFEVELAALGFPPPYTRAMLAAQDDELVALVLAPTVAFDQTPGPGAGREIVLRPAGGA